MLARLDRNAGMPAILLDRNNYFEDTGDCPRIQGLMQVLDYLNSPQKLGTQ